MTAQTITNDTVVGIHYTLKGEDGETIDSSAGQPPFIYLQGHGQVVPGLESALLGKNVGDKFPVEISAEDGYGDYVAEMSMTFPKSQFPEGAAFEVDNEFELVGENNEVIPARITAVEADSITLDANHPLAGKKLFFEIEIVSLRAATAEELEHGHAHGVGESHD